jgi:hypothetical protein
MGRDSMGIRKAIIREGIIGIGIGIFLMLVAKPGGDIFSTYAGIENATLGILISAFSVLSFGVGKFITFKFVK